MEAMQCDLLQCLAAAANRLTACQKAEKACCPLAAKAL